MKKVGMILLCFSAFFYTLRYITAAIYGSSSQGWSKETFDALLGYVGSGPLVLSWLTFIAGLLILIVSLFGKQIKSNLQLITTKWKEEEVVIDED